VTAEDIHFSYLQGIVLN